MKIPVGNFGFSTPTPTQAPDTSAETTALAHLGQAITHVGQQIDDKQQEVARAKDLTSYQNYSLAVDQLKVNYKNAIESGEVPFEEAQQKFNEDVQKIPAPRATARGPVAAENMNRGVQGKIKSTQLDIAQLADGARDSALQAQGSQQLDTLGKRAGLPGADIDSINAQADAVAPTLRAGGLSELHTTKIIQDFKDNNWFNQAQLRAMQSRDSLDGLKQMEHDLTAADGYYVNRLDSNKRNAVLSQVITHRMQLENKMRVNADKTDAAAERALNQIDQQIASGVPATAEMWNDWGSIIKPSSYANQFAQRQADEAQVQNVLRQPIVDQVKFVQDKEASLLSEGGSVREATNLARLKAAVQRNVQLLQQQPLVFNSNRTGQDVEPLDVGGLLSGDATVAHQIGDRMTTLKAMQKQYGTQVPLRPLLPQEAQMLTGLLDKSTPSEQSQIFAGLYNAVGDAQAYQGAMQQIAPDSPVVAHAGLLAAEQAQLTTKAHWFKPDDTVTNSDVAGTLLYGNSILNPSKAAKEEDGKPKLSLYLPEQKSLQDEFSAVVGNAFAGDSKSAEAAYQAVKAYYVGRAAQKGTIAQGTSGHADPDLVQEAVKAVLGNVVNYNGRGSVIAPWGMSESGFNDRVQMAFMAELKKRGMSDALIATLPSLGLQNYTDENGVDKIRFTQGKSIVYDNKGKPFEINVNEPINYQEEVPRGRARGGGYDYVTKQK